jgi:hypothetical protein
MGVSMNRTFPVSEGRLAQPPGRLSQSPGHRLGKWEHRIWRSSRSVRSSNLAHCLVARKVGNLGGRSDRKSTGTTG